jgi:SNF2 family DNA or RNA helicase
LIVLPTVAIRQCQTEIARFTDPGALTVQVYHGSDRNTDVQDLLNTDVVITSYKVVATRRFPLPVRKALSLFTYYLFSCL